MIIFYFYYKYFINLRKKTLPTSLKSLLWRFEKEKAIRSGFVVSGRLNKINRDNSDPGCQPWRRVGGPIINMCTLLLTAGLRLLDKALVPIWKQFKTLPFSRVEVWIVIFFFLLWTKSHWSESGTKSDGRIKWAVRRARLTATATLSW